MLQSFIDYISRKNISEDDIHRFDTDIRHFLNKFCYKYYMDMMKMKKKFSVVVDYSKSKGYPRSWHGIHNVLLVDDYENLFETKKFQFCIYCDDRDIIKKFLEEEFIGEIEITFI